MRDRGEGGRVVGKMCDVDGGQIRQRTTNGFGGDEENKPGGAEGGGGVIKKENG